VIQVALGALFAALVAGLAYRAHALTAGGAAAAFAVGTLVFGSGGWPAAAVLFAFFLPSSLLSRVGAARKRALAGDDRHGPRSGWQVLANGGVAAVCALAAARAGSEAFAAAFAGAFAAASADTWGTEIGTLAARAPVSILTFRRLRAGQSGGVTLLGSAATVAGALCVAIVASLVGLAPLRSIVAGGIAGATLDSLLGASLQALRWCPHCACECETLRHSCGTQTVLRRGASWLENDGVNFAATLCGALVAAAAARW
jgi:uncharacterized protein (TIGR00297 family)